MLPEDAGGGAAPTPRAPVAPDKSQRHLEARSLLSRVRRFWPILSPLAGLVRGPEEMGRADPLCQFLNVL